MPPPDYTLTNYRIDRGGHIKALEFCNWYFAGEIYTRSWRWYDLDGNIIESGDTPQTGDRPQTHDLRLDARGHVVAVSVGLTWPLPHWYTLAREDLGVVQAIVGLRDIRLDARGHVVAVRVMMENYPWYDLNRELAA